MSTLSPYDAELVGLLRSELHLSETAVIKPESSVGTHPILFDLVIEDGGKLFVIEIKRIIRLAANAGIDNKEVKKGTVPVKITGAKSWQVISRLLMMNPVSSIRQLA